MGCTFDKFPQERVENTEVGGTTIKEWVKRFSYTVTAVVMIRLWRPMMARAIVFDTYAYVKKLKAVGFTEEQAEAQAEAIAELVDERLATKRDLKELELRLTIRLGTIVATGIVIVAALVKLL